MNLGIRDGTGKETGRRSLPSQFKEELRPDLISRAVKVMQMNKRTPYGAKPTAGKRSSAKLSRRRRNFRGSYGIGISRVPRKIMSRRGTRHNWVGAFAPGMVGGRRAHPPKAHDFSIKINVKERRKAIRSALTYTIIRDEVVKRGHKVPAQYPFLLDSNFEKLSKTKDVVSAFESLDLSDELVRSAVKKIRPGKGKGRGRKYRKKTGPLLVVSEDCPLMNAGRNIPGVDIAIVSRLNTELLAPGAVPGRLTLFTDAAIEKMAKDHLFMGTLPLEAHAPVAKPVKKKAVKKVAEE